jgi:hypothetical protein
VYVTGFDGNLSVFEAAGCGAAVCEPLRTGVNFADGKVLLNSTDNTVTPDVPAQTNLYVLALQ